MPSYERLQRGSAAGAAGIVTPTAAGFATLATIPGLSATNLGVFRQFTRVAGVNNEGTISVLGRNIPVGDVYFASPNFFTPNHAVINPDYNQSSTTPHHWRFSMTNGAEIDNSANLPIFFTSLPLKQPAVQNILHDTSLNLPNACLNQNNFMHPTKMNSERSGGGPKMSQDRDMELSD